MDHERSDSWRGVRWLIYLVAALVAICAVIIGFGGHVGLVTPANAADGCTKYSDLPPDAQAWLNSHTDTYQEAAQVLCALEVEEFGPYSTTMMEQDVAGVADYGTAWDWVDPDYAKSGCKSNRGKVYDRTRSIWPFYRTLNEAYLVMRICRAHGRIWSHHVRKYSASPAGTWRADTSNGWPIIRKGWRTWHGDGHGAYRFYFEPHYKQCLSSGLCIDNARLPIAITGYGDGHFHTKNEFPTH